MTRQKKIQLLILACAPAVFAVGCSDATPTAPVAAATTATPSPSTIRAKLDKMHKDTDWIGAFHNDALRYVLADIKRLPLTSRNALSVCEAARRSYAEFHRTRRGSAVPASVDADFENFCSRSRKPTIAPSVLANPRRGPNAAQYAVTDSAYMDQVYNAIDASTSLADLNARVSAIESSAANSLSYDAAQGVVIVGNVALSSANYWADNVNDWTDFTSSYLYSMQPSATKLFATTLRSTVSGRGRVNAPSFNWWDDAKAAARRAASGDAKAAGRAVLAAGLAGLPIVYDVVIGAAATGSIIAVLQM